jgi:hypothetical protein
LLHGERPGFEAAASKFPRMCGRDTVLDCGGFPPLLQFDLSPRLQATDQRVSFAKAAKYRRTAKRLRLYDLPELANSVMARSRSYFRQALTAKTSSL